MKKIHALKVLGSLQLQKLIMLSFLHGLYHLEKLGQWLIVLPHGVLFRGAAEGKIRKNIIKENLLDAVIGFTS